MVDIPPPPFDAADIPPPVDAPPPPLPRPVARPAQQAQAEAEADEDAAPPGADEDDAPPPLPARDCEPQRSSGQSQQKCRSLREREPSDDERKHTHRHHKSHTMRSEGACSAGSDSPWATSSGAATPPAPAELDVPPPPAVYATVDIPPPSLLAAGPGSPTSPDIVPFPQAAEHPAPLRRTSSGKTKPPPPSSGSGSPRNKPPPPLSGGRATPPPPCERSTPTPPSLSLPSPAMSPASALSPVGAPPPLMPPRDFKSPRDAHSPALSSSPGADQIRPPPLGVPPPPAPGHARSSSALPSVGRVQPPPPLCRPPPADASALRASADDIAPPPVPRKPSVSDDIAPPPIPRKPSVSDDIAPPPVPRKPSVSDDIAPPPVPRKPSVSDDIAPPPIPRKPSVSEDIMPPPPTPRKASVSDDIAPPSLPPPAVQGAVVDIPPPPMAAPAAPPVSAGADMPPPPFVRSSTRPQSLVVPSRVVDVPPPATLATNTPPVVRASQLQHSRSTEDASLVLAPGAKSTSSGKLDGAAQAQAPAFHRSLTVRGEISLELQKSDSDLPPGWQQCTDPKGRTYYYNRALRVTQWERPRASNAEKPPLPPGWEEKTDANGRVYYSNRAEKRSQCASAAAPSVPAASLTAAEPHKHADGPVKPEKETQSVKSRLLDFFRRRPKAEELVAKNILPSDCTPLAIEKAQAGKRAEAPAVPALQTSAAAVQPASAAAAIMAPQISPRRPAEVAVHKGGQKPSGLMHSDDMDDAEALPPGWDEVTDASSGRKYYYNKTLRKTQWSRPAADSIPPPESPRDDAPLPAGWEERDANGRKYYVNKALKQQPMSQRSGDQSARPLDAESQACYQQILELLLTGGYFRARITGISPFDKVLGGLAWAISASNVDVDVDVFQETATTGQKIRIGESVVRALVRMKCPFPLQTHQIQGHDYKSIFPVVQWLIKKVIETRNESGDTARAFSEYRFAKEAADEAKAATEAFMAEVRARYRPQRKFRRHKETQPSCKHTLLEYGVLRLKPRAESSEGPDAGAEGRGGAGDTDDEYLSGMASLADGAGAKVAGSVVGSYIETRDIQDAASRYGTGDDEAAAAAGQSGQGQKNFAEKVLRQKTAHTLKEIDRASAQLEQMRKKHAEREAEVAALETQLAKKLRLNRRIVAEIRKLEQLETPENATILNQLRALVALNESLKGQEARFRANCKRQMAQLREEIERRKKSMYGDDDMERIELINDTLQKDLDKIARIRQLWSKKTRDISTVERKIDDVPSRAELAQYQRMFVELYEQVATKLVETRRYYCTYNRLEDTRVCLGREVEIIESITGNYEKAMKDKANKEKLVESMEAIAKQVQQSNEKKEADLAKEREKSTELQEKLQALVEQERAFHRITKEFLEECQKNEKLEAKLSQLKGSEDA
eukprot:m51a1_g4620 hypothetical protein (1410) ;mRNA; r:291183-296569